MRRSVLWVRALLLGVCLLLLVWPEGRTAPQRKVRKVYAVLIGLNKYKDRSIETLKYTGRDVQGIYRVLTGVGRVPRRNVRILLNRRATKKRISYYLRTWLYNKIRGSGTGATALVYFSGHGWSGGGLSYWLAYDSRAGSPGQIKRSAVSHESVSYWLGRLRSRRVVLFVDACNSGFAWSGKKSLRMVRKGFRRVLGAKNFGEGRVTIASSMQNQYSVESDRLRHGVFSYVLIDALKGGADYDGDGQVTLPEVWTHLSGRVRRLALKYKKYPQVPVKSGPEAGPIPLSFPGRRKPPPRQERSGGGGSGARKDKGVLLVSSKPLGGTVKLNGSYAGECGQGGLRKVLSGGKWKVEVLLKGYKKWEREVLLGEGETMRLKARLEKERYAGQVQQVKGLSGAKEVYIPAGTFTMGSPKSEPGRNSRERQRLVKLSRGFWMLQTEVTQGLFKALLKYNPSYFSSCGDRCPVEKVNWYEALAYANALSKKGGKEECYSCSGSGKGVKCSVRSKYRGKRYYSCPGYRLPTEAEWEYAARAGTRTAIYSGSLKIKGLKNAPMLDGIAWYGGNSGVSYSGGFDCSRWKEKQYSSSRCGPHPVGRKQANSWGLYDMLGNVWEWCWDRYGRYTGSRVVDPVGASTGSYRVYRGGCWNLYAWWTRAADRNVDAPGGRLYFLGFRLVRADPR